MWKKVIAIWELVHEGSSLTILGMASQKKITVRPGPIYIVASHHVIFNDNIILVVMYSVQQTVLYSKLINLTN